MPKTKPTRQTPTPRFRVTPKRSTAIYGAVHEGIMRLRVKLQRENPSDVDWAISKCVGEIHQLVVSALNASRSKGTR